jgi:hypothetical protein
LGVSSAIGAAAIGEMTVLAATQADQARDFSELPRISLQRATPSLAISRLFHAQ